MFWPAVTSPSGVDPMFIWLIFFSYLSSSLFRLCISSSSSIFSRALSISKFNLFRSLTSRLTYFLRTSRSISCVSDWMVISSSFFLYLFFLISSCWSSCFSLLILSTFSSLIYETYMRDLLFLSLLLTNFEFDLYTDSSLLSSLAPLCILLSGVYLLRLLALFLTCEARLSIWLLI